MELRTLITCNNCSNFFFVSRIRHLRRGKNEVLRFFFEVRYFNSRINIKCLKFCFQYIDTLVVDKCADRNFNKELTV
jgi:hypothetical protein